MGVTVTAGHAALDPVKYRIVSAVEGPWWWPQMRWYIETDYGRFGSFDTEGEAFASAFLMSMAS